jgi:predicted dehydrogenase
VTAGLRAGIVGAGFIGGVHARAVRAAGGTVAAVLSRTPQSTQQAAAALGAERAAVTVAELVKAADVDVVHICTPNQTHVDLARSAIAAGKAVICEKPLATSVPDARLLVEEAAEAGVAAFVPFVYRFYPSVWEARARISSDPDAGLWLLHGSYLQDWLAAPDAANWRVDPRLGGASRAFGDVGVHWCDLMEFTTGHRITRLTATMNTAFKDRSGGSGEPATEDGAVVLFETDRGAVGSVVVSQVSPGRKNRLWFSFDGTRASYSFDQELPDSLWIGAAAENRVVMRGPETFSHSGAAYVTLPAGHPQGYQDAFNAFVADAYAGAAGLTPDGLPTFTDGLRAATITQAVVDSSIRRSWVDVPP